MKTTKKQTTKYHPVAWQMEAERITTDTVQYWRNGCMMTAMMSNQAAQEAVRSGSAFVITRQAIGALDENGYSIA